LESLQIAVGVSTFAYLAYLIGSTEPHRKWLQKINKAGGDNRRDDPADNDVAKDFKVNRL
jgi:hypothetical protein